MCTFNEDLQMNSTVIKNSCKLMSISVEKPCSKYPYLTADLCGLEINAMTKYDVLVHFFVPSTMMLPVLFSFLRGALEGSHGAGVIKLNRSSTTLFRHTLLF